MSTDVGPAPGTPTTVGGLRKEEEVGKEVAAALDALPALFAGVDGYELREDVAYYRVVAYTRTTRWSFFARFSSFYHVLHARLLESAHAEGQPLPPFPERRVKLLCDHANRHFLHCRMVVLGAYLTALVRHPVWSSAPALRQFLIPGMHVIDSRVAAIQGLGPKSANERALMFAGMDSPRTRAKSQTSRGELGEQTYARALSAECVRLLSGPEGASKPWWCPDGTRSESLSIEMVPEVAAIRIPSVQIVRDDHVVYQIDVSFASRRQTSSWSVLRRFSEFCALRQTMMDDLDHYGHRAEELLPPLPERHLKIWVDHFDRCFIDYRRIVLESFLVTVTVLPYLKSHPALLHFLGV